MDLSYNNLWRKTDNLYFQSTTLKKEQGEKKNRLGDFSELHVLNIYTNWNLESFF